MIVSLSLLIPLNLLQQLVGCLHGILGEIIRDSDESECEKKRNDSPEVNVCHISPFLHRQSTNRTKRINGGIKLQETPLISRLLRCGSSEPSADGSALSSPSLPPC